MVPGRIPVIPGVDVVLGPCINIVPFREQVGPATTTRELMCAVYAQHVDSMEHEHIGFRCILSLSHSEVAAQGHNATPPQCRLTLV